MNTYILIDSNVWINAIENAVKGREKTVVDHLEELGQYSLITSTILKDEFKPKANPHPDRDRNQEPNPVNAMQRRVDVFINEKCKTPHPKTFNDIFFETYQQVIMHLDEYYEANKQAQEKHYLQETSRQSSLSDGDLSLVLLPFVEPYCQDSKIVIFTNDGIRVRPSSRPSTKELTKPRLLFHLLKDKILNDNNCAEVIFIDREVNTFDGILKHIEEEIKL